MRNLKLLDIYRLTDAWIKSYYGGIGDETCGYFAVPSPIDRKPLAIIASANAGWDHISVSRRERCPNWKEMEHIKRLFFKEDETAM